MIRIEYENGEVVKCLIDDSRERLLEYDHLSEDYSKLLQVRESRVRTVIAYSTHSSNSGPFRLTRIIRNIPYLVDSSNAVVSPQIWKGEIAQFIVDNLSEIHIPED